MTSPLIAEVTARHLRLIENAAFNPMLAPPPPSRIKAMFAPVRQLLGLAPTTEGAPSAAQLRERIERLTPAEHNALYSDISKGVAGCLAAVTEAGHRVVTVRCVSTDPKAAALIVNKTIETYLGQQTDEFSGNLRDRIKQTTIAVEEARERIVSSEKELAEYRIKLNLGPEENSSSLQKNVNDLRTQLSAAEASASSAEAGQRQGITQDLTSGNVLRAQCAEAQAEFARAQEVLGPAHPAFIAARNRVGSTCGQLQRLDTAGEQQIRAAARAKRDEVERLKRDLQKAEELVARQTENAVSLKALQVEVETARQHYTATQSRLQNLEQLAAQRIVPQARQLSFAEPARVPFSPRKDLITMVAFLASLGVGVGLAIVIELMDSGFRSVHQLEEQTGVPVLGMMPFQAGRSRRGTKPWENIVEKPNSAYAEALRTIRTGIQITSSDAPQRTVVVTSSVPGEGKTTTAISLATASAASGARTLTIDCDMRQPSMHTNLGVDNDVGLSEFLSGQRSLEEVVRVEPRTGLYYILAGRRPPSPTDLLGGLRMQRLLQQLGDAFEMVVLDSPPIMAVSDALLLVRQADATLFVVRWEKTRRDVATAGVKMVYEAGARLAGLVLTQVDLRRHAQYDYTDSYAYYYRGYKRYYSE